MRIEARFEKKGEMKFISHLDLMRVFERALRRAELPVMITRGFSPHLKISIKRALKLGLESEDETVFVYLDREFSPDELVKKLNVELPCGIKILSASLTL